MKEVLDFYKFTPFNYSKDIKFYTNQIKSTNQILEYEDLHKLCLRKKFFKNKINNVLEFGCGTGWLTNSLSYHYKKEVTAVDFTKKAIETAKSVSKTLKVKPQYVLSDIFDYKDCKKYNLVVSLGVLHHTKDCKSAFEKISNFIAPGGYLYVGLYHLYSRRPMLDFLRGAYIWHGENYAFNLFKFMAKNLDSPDHSYSWFRDQVIHPHETQHTLIEIFDWLDNCGLKLQSTSINKYKSLKNFSKERLDNIERDLENYSYKKNCEDLEFSPGYFTICAKKI